MTRPRPTYMPTPRIWSWAQVACRLGKGETWLREHLPELYDLGFPKMDELLNGWDADAVNLWLDQRSGIADASLIDPGKELESWSP